MAKYCPHCGNPVDPGDNFCSNCATPLNRTGTAGTVGAGGQGNGPSGREGKSVTITFPGSLGGLQGASISDNLPLIIADGALLAVLALAPWVTTFFTSGGISLPKLVKYVVDTASTAQQYSGYAYQLGGGSIYEKAMGILVLIGLVTGIGGVCSCYGLVKDLINDYKGQRADGTGAMLCGIVGAAVIIIVWIGKIGLSSQLQNEYMDLSYLGRDFFDVTMWVWVAAVGGIGFYLYRKKMYGEQQS